MHVSLDPQEFLPLIQRTVAETVARIDQERSAFGDRLAFSEVEAADMLGLEPHTLREARRKGAISFSRGPNRRILYAREDLLGYLASTRTGREGC